jgi:hypothetical protein
LIRTQICLTIDWFLPGTNSGGPVRSIANLTAALPEIDFYIITRNTDYCSTEPYEGIPANTWVQQEANVWVYYFSEDQLTKKKLKEVMNGVQASSVYVSGIYSLAFSQWPLSIAKSLGSKTIIAARGMLSPHALAVKPMKKYLFLSFMRPHQKKRRISEPLLENAQLCPLYRMLLDKSPQAHKKSPRNKEV